MKLIIRSLADSLAVYPALLLLSDFADLSLPLAGWIGLAWLAAAGGRALPAILRRRMPAAIVHVALVLILAAAAAAVDPWLLALVVPLGALSWIARYDWRRIVRCSVAVGLHAVVLAAAPLLGIDSAARPWLAAAGILWLAASIYFVQASSLSEAGLGAGLVTRRLAAAGRRYAAIWGLLVAIVFLPFAGVPIWPAIARLVRWLIALMPQGKPAPEPPPETEPPAQQPVFPEQASDTGRIWVWLEYAMYVALALLALAAVYLIGRRYLLNAVWWRRLSERIKTWYDRMLQGKRQNDEDPGYTEERESLLQGERLLSRLFARRRSKAKPALRREEWAALPAEARVRSLYAAVLDEAVREGYAHRDSHTPSETLRAIEAWESARGAPRGQREQSDMRRWLAAMSAKLGELYGKARYGSGVKPEEAERLGADYPWRR
ncbi:hypothetical protein [Cohnella sp. 56]|uniref:hypothetical protein n=1 Tax=Cohnella sp. 56 TaxID=3113722 RepID=UPI0030EABE2E